MYISLAVLAAAIAVFLFVPLPYSVVCSLEIQARDADPVYVDVADGGRLEKIEVQAGDQVTKGQEVGRLKNVDTELEIARLTGLVDQYRAKLDSARRQSYRDSRALGELSQIQETLSTYQRQLDEKQKDQAHLRLVAPAVGTVLPPPETPARDEPEVQLPTWSGTPLEPKNQGAQLDEGVLFCQVGDPTKFEAILVIDQTDVEFVRELLAKSAQPQVDIKLDSLPSQTFRSEITGIADSDLKISPKRLSAKAGGELATTTDPHTGQEKLRNTSYQARAPLDDPNGLLRIGLRGQGRIYTAWQPLGTRLWRLLSHTFNFKM
jgi:multidrug efflux pump subunit AcrA (membrane-fusion protein)